MKRFMIEVYRKSSGKVVFREEYDTHAECLQVLRRFDLTKYGATIIS